MLSLIQTLRGYSLHSLDGALGSVKEFYFDDRHWTIRYLVADTGNWLTGRTVLISPYALSGINRSLKQLSINLTKKQIENSPSPTTHKPVSQQFEEEYNGYYGWPAYWNGPYVWGGLPYLERDPNRWKPSTHANTAWDRHLRSSREVTGYSVQALDGELGHVEDFVVDDESWTFRYLIIGTRNWWPGKKVLVSPQWIERVSWEESKAFINLSRETIQKSPEYSAEALLTREYETGLHHHYQRKGYWIDELASV
jgi:uncharacterized protein YrrD